ncbi:hypothetical protein [Erythrobacter sp. SD-21]|uniref:hypothetical protein n=1 Tax=Erythrobacter sp. SD-21 TaxID=161528 RepID=UPI0002FC54B2|nr:hypothetical protein [Erythrobacter sp. SD-21]
MRTLAILAPLTLAACGQASEPEAQPESTAQAEAPSPEFYTMDPVTFDIVGENVVYATTELREDGTYIDSAEGQEGGRGTWKADGPEVCFDPEGDDEGQQERCWTNSPMLPDGSFVTTRDDGSESYTVKPRAAE